MADRSGIYVLNCRLDRPQQSDCATLRRNAEHRKHKGAAPQDYSNFQRSSATQLSILFNAPLRYFVDGNNERAVQFEG